MTSPVTITDTTCDVVADTNYADDFVCDNSVPGKCPISLYGIGQYGTGPYGSGLRISNLVHFPYDITQSPWEFGGGTGSVEADVGKFAGRSFCRGIGIDTGSPGPGFLQVQPIVLPVDGDYFVQWLMKADGGAGGVQHLFYDQNRAQVIMEIVSMVNNDGTIVNQGLGNPPLRHIALGVDNVYLVTGLAKGCIGGHTHLLYAFDPFPPMTLNSLLVTEFIVSLEDPRQLPLCAS